MVKAYLFTLVPLLICCAIPKCEASENSAKLGPTKSSTSAGTSINVAPLALIESPQDDDEKQREQITKLWDACLSRSPDINFVLQKLSPDRKIPKETLMRLLETSFGKGCQFAGSGYMMIADPSMGDTNYVNLLSIRRDSSYLTLKERRPRASSSVLTRISQTEQIQLFNMIRATADKLVDKYRAYVSNFAKLHNPDPNNQESVEYLKCLLAKEREDLVDLAGPSAVEDLDASLFASTPISSK